MSFLKEIAKLLEPAPSLPDLEEINNEGSQVNKTRFNEENNEPVQRRRIIGPSYQDDEKYSGQKVLRCDIFDENVTKDGVDDFKDSDFTDIDDETGDGENSDELDNNEDEVEDEDVVSGDEDDILEDEDEENDDEGSISEGELKEALEDDEEDISDNEEPTNGIEHEDEDGSELSDNDDVDDTTQNMKKILIDKEKESKKADSVRQELKHWDQLLFLKIKLQSALRAYNQLPRGRLAKELLKKCDETTRNNILQARKNAKELVELLLSAEKTLLASSPLTQAIVGIDGGMADSDDEEIESSEDEAEEDDNEDIEDEEDDIEEEETAEADTVGHSWKAIEIRLKENDSKFEKFRNTTLVKWDERTRLTGPRRAKDAKKDFSAFEQGNIISQIDKVMNDKPRLLSKTQKKRSDNDRIGADPEADFDAEIYDDDDFYQVLLKEMLDRKTNSSNDPIAMTRHYIEMQHLRNRRSKKKVFDSKLSKDRKIKYIAIPKLVNFHPARPELVKWTHETRNELFKSLFK